MNGTVTSIQAEAEPTYVPYCARVQAQEEKERKRRIYHAKTVALLRKYMRYSIETGRMPSLLGREFFRAKVSARSMVTFEDRVIFVHDVEKCLARLDEFSQQLIARRILQEHDQAATARLLHCTEKTVRLYLAAALDLVTEVLLELGLMQPLEWDEPARVQNDEPDPVT